MPGWWLSLNRTISLQEFSYVQDELCRDTTCWTSYQPILCFWFVHITFPMLGLLIHLSSLCLHNTGYDSLYFWICQNSFDWNRKMIFDVFYYIYMLISYHVFVKFLFDEHITFSILKNKIRDNLVWSNMVLCNLFSLIWRCTCFL